jgi:hypothetical protein
MVGSFLELINPTDEARMITKYQELSGSLVGPVFPTTSTTTLVLDSLASSISGEYNNLYIFINAEYVIITDYTVTNVSGVITRTATVSPALLSGATSGNPYVIRSGVVETPFPTTLSMHNFCILPFSYDNMNPFNFTGSSISQQEMVCYEIELESLVLPNSPMNSGLGGLIAFYPFVYVELKNVSAPGAGGSSTIYSNNPNSTKMLFRVALTDVQNPVISPYIRVGSGMSQTVKFKPNDNLRFCVHLPNGELFKTVDLDTMGPQQPDDLLQISALFAIKRL